MPDHREPTADGPPQWSSRLLNRLAHPDTREEVAGDMLEMYRYRLGQFGKRKADRLYVIDTLRLLRPFARSEKREEYSSSYLFSLVMIRNYFKIALRNLLKNKGYSAINVAGLAVGMAVALLIGLWVFDELSFNRSHEHYAKIAQVMQNQNFGGTVRTGNGLPMQLEKELRDKYGSHFRYIVLAGGGGDHLLSVGDKKVIQNGRYMGPEIAEMLSLKMLEGTRAGLTEMNAVLLSESAAKATFGDADPMDKIIRIDNMNDVRVAGVYADLPANSSFAGLSFIAPWKLLEKGLPDWLGWGNNWFDIYVQIADNAEMDRVSAAIARSKFNAVDEEQQNTTRCFFYSRCANGTCIPNLKTA